jgi:hypothetical protein
MLFIIFKSYKFLKNIFYLENYANHVVFTISKTYKFKKCELDYKIRDDKCLPGLIFMLRMNNWNLVVHRKQFIPT